MKKSFVKIGILLLIVVGVVFFLLYENCWKQSNNNTNNNDNNKEEIITEKTIFDKDQKKALKVLNKMTLEEKIGQLFLVRYDKSRVETDANKYPGGYILFAKDFENNTKEEMIQEIKRDQTLSKYPLVMAVDEEGGYVTRISRFPSYRKEKFASPKYYYETGGYDLLEQMENEKAKLLKEVGINLNLAPVADVSVKEEDFIYSRAFGKDATETSAFIKNMVKYANNNEISSCLKHFPGYGSNVDTHKGIAIDERSYENFKENDYLPFQAGIEEKVPCILVSHNVVNAIDESYPASLSKKMIEELRNTLHYTGIIMTDDLDMDAVKSYVEDGKAATLAINAGNDMIITSDFDGMYEELLTSVKEGRIEEETINKAVLRILSWKYYYHLFS